MSLRSMASAQPLVSAASALSKAPVKKPPQFHISTVSKWFLSLVVLECLALASVSIWSLCTVTVMYTRLSLIVVLGTCVTLAFFAIDAVYTENEFQLFAFFALSGLLFARVVWGYFNPQDGHRSDTLQLLFLIGLVLASVFEAAYIILGLVIEDSVWASFGNYKYKLISALQRDQDNYSTYQKYVTLLLLDLSVSMAWIVLAFADLTDLSLALNGSAILVSLVWAIIGWMAVIREQISVMYAFWSLSVLWPAYVAYQAYQLLQDDNNWGSKGFNFAAAGLSTVVVRVLLLYVSRTVAANFGQGLKEKVFGKQWARVVNYGSVDATQDDAYVAVGGAHAVNASERV